MAELVVLADADELARVAAHRMGECIASVLGERRKASVALSGGSTPGPSYRRLATTFGSSPAESALDVARIRWFFVDERAVGPEHERSNYRALERDLFEPGRIPREHVFRMQGELSPEAAAEAYSAVLARELGEPPVLDLVIAGLGSDGHTASLFPKTRAVSASGSVVAVFPADLEPRISLGRSTLLRAREVFVLVCGADKRAALSRALEHGDEDEVPGRVYLAAAGRVTFLVDRAANPG